MKEGYGTVVWFKFPAHSHFLDAEAALGMVELYLFDHINHSLGALILGHKIRDELDVVDDCYK